MAAPKQEPKASGGVSAGVEGQTAPPAATRSSPAPHTSAAGAFPLRQKSGNGYGSVAFAKSHTG